MRYKIRCSKRGLRKGSIMVLEIPGSFLFQSKNRPHFLVLRGLPLRAKGVTSKNPKSAPTRGTRYVGGLGNVSSHRGRPGSIGLGFDLERPEGKKTVPKRKGKAISAGNATKSSKTRPGFQKRGCGEGRRCSESVEESAEKPPGGDVNEYRWLSIATEPNEIQKSTP